MEYEDVLRSVGSFGRFQMLLCAIALVQSLPSAFGNLFFAFGHLMPDFHCRVPDADGHAENSTEYERILNQTIPWETRNGVTERSHCKMFAPNANATVACLHGWSYSSAYSAVAEFNMVCENSWKAPLSILLYMVGAGLGSFSGILSDRFGRKTIFLGCSYAQFITCGMMGLAWNYPSYAAFGLISGVPGIINYVAAFVLITEMIDKDRRAAMGIYFPVTFSVAYILTPLLGYMFPYWRHYLWATALVGILYIPLIWLCPESLRWLLVSGREKEAKLLLKKIACMNGRQINADQIYGDFQASMKMMDANRSVEECRRLKKESSYIHFLQNKTMLIRSIVGYLQWSASSMVYYAIALYPSGLSGNYLINIFLAGLVEFPALAFAYFAVRYIGRVRAAVFSFFIAGTSCCIAPFIPKGLPSLVTVLVLLGKGAVSATFNIAYIIVDEITPTLVRTTSMGVACASARVGTVIMPYLMYSGQAVNGSLPFLCMGGLALITGLLTAFIIPETKNVPMPDTIAEALQNKRIYRFNMCKKFPQKKQRKDEIHLQPTA